MNTEIYNTYNKLYSMLRSLIFFNDNHCNQGHLQIFSTISLLLAI